MNKIDKLIINSPYTQPQQYWEYIRDSRDFVLKEGRRPAGYIVASKNSKSFDDPGVFIEIGLVNQIRTRVDRWRELGYPGVTGITKRLLNHWQDPEERIDRKFFFCQLEAIETLIWLTEAPDTDKRGIDIPSDGGAFSRWCNKMATGSGKTIVMSMLIAWNVLNKVNNNKDKRFSKNVLVIAPGLTVKSRLSVLNPTGIENYYEEFNIVPSGLMDSLRLGKVKIINWHNLAWDTEEKIAKKKSIDKRGAKSDLAYVKEVLGDMSNACNLIVINDEAHHAWRLPAETAKKIGIIDEDIKKSTIWVSGLDRINKARGILRCFDLSATPFTPSGKKASEEALYQWIVSDFGLNDAIESGLVKTPRVVVRDDGRVDRDLRSRLYHIYMDETVKDDLNQKKVDKSTPLPDLIKNAYLLLCKDWKATKDEWQAAGHKIPPVIVTVANTTFTSARIKHSFDSDSFMLTSAGLGELVNPEITLQIDSTILKTAEAQSEEIQVDDSPVNDNEDDTPEVALTQKERAELLRRTVDTVGRIGEPGEQIQNVLSVGMLSEGWDAKTVTHIMGLRAFSSQLLCEQVVGRGLRRTSYEVGEDGLFEAEYVNIFGVPFTFLPHEGGEDGPPPPPPKPKTEIKVEKSRLEHEITFPNLIRTDRIFKPRLTIDLSQVDTLELDPYDSITEAELQAIVAGKPNPAALSEIDLKEISEKLRLQTIIFRIASTIYNSEKRPEWKGSKELFLIQLIPIVEQFINSGKIIIKNSVFNEDEARKRILIMLNMNKVIQHVWNVIRLENTESLTPVFDKENPIRSTNDLRSWWTSKPCETFNKTHTNFVVCDSTWEYLEAKTLNESQHIKSFIKNDHLAFAIFYVYQGVVRRYFPDFICKLTNGKNLIIETKGQVNEQHMTKRAHLNEWCDAINQHGGFGDWAAEVSFDPNDLQSKILKHV